jgi:hypothetical protein
LTVKLEHRVGSEWLPFRYGNTFVREEVDGTPRLRIGARGGHVQLLLQCVDQLTPPFGVLYVLHTPRGGSAPGRYQSLPLDRSELVAFLRRFGTFLAGDSRHDLWLHSLPDDVTLVWDRHDLVLAYGALGTLTEVMESGGLREGWPEVPVPHAHHYHPAWDHAEHDLLRALEWERFPLEPDDEQGPDFRSAGVTPDRPKA